MMNNKIEKEFINNVIEDHRQMQLALYDAQQMIKTLIANQILVRELHEPVEMRQYRNRQEVWLTGCKECMYTGSDYEYFVEYPCSTVKALEGNRDG